MAGPAAGGGVERPFERSLSLHGIRFAVYCENSASLNPLTITPSGLGTDNTPVTVEADGVVTGAEVADLDADGSPEVYVYVRSAGGGSYGTLVAYGTNRKKSMSAIYMPALVGDHRDAHGYRGHDGFAVVENRLVRRFPVYNEGDSDASPTGGTRQMQYRLEPGEAGWSLVLDRVVGY